MLSAQSAPATAEKPALSLWRLDCGDLDVDLSTFSDVGLYAGQRKKLVGSCYLIKNGDRYLLWDTGLDGDLVGKERDKNGNFLRQKVTTQLARLGLGAADIDYVGISHFHYDHTGQVADFPNATLLIGDADWKIATAWRVTKPRFEHWSSGAGKADRLEEDRDVFGDGRVTILKMPGHTLGHQALLVRLESGPVMISGDEYHFAENRRIGGVPAFNMDRAATLASHDRFEKLAANLKAKVIIQHEPADVSKLPLFPEAAN